jgi:hypothetical protein
VNVSAPDGRTTITVPAGPDDLVGARMPTPAECRALGILTPDVPVLAIKRPGHDEELFDARRVIVVNDPENVCH